jgi:hypothetical protein
MNMNININTNMNTVESVWTKLKPLAQHFVQSHCCCVSRKGTPLGLTPKDNYVHEG